MHVTELVCVQCEETYPPEEIRYECTCGGSLDVVYDYSEIASAMSWDRLHDRGFSHFRYREFLPVVADEHMVMMGGGGTPLAKSASIGPDHDIDLWFKLESLNPTGSFKDRGTSVELGKALDHGADQVVVASTGNMGASIAAYAARAGIPATIYVPESVQGTPKFRQMKMHDADIVPVDGDYDAAAERAWQDWAQDDIYLMGDYPYRGEGEKTVGHEIGDQMRAQELAVDTVAVPVGNGTLIHAVWKGLQELAETGLLDDVPAVTGVQAAGCNTVVDALQKGFDTVEAVDKVDTVAGAIACGDPLDGDHALHAIQDSGGTGIAVDDDAILDARQRLAAREGIYAEEAGAAALAGIIDHADQFAGETVICCVTGHGLKT